MPHRPTEPLPPRASTAPRPPRSALARFALAAPLSPEALEALRARCWRERGLVLIAPEEIANDFLRQGLINEATGRWGRAGAPRRSA
jgi:hypothetical protein